MSMASSFAADTDSTETSAPGVAEADEATTIIVQLAAGSVGDDRASPYKNIKQRIARSVSQASPGGTIGDVRDYHHALDGFSITAPASARGAIKSVQGVKDAFFDGQREPVFYPEMSGDGGAAVADPAKETRSDQVAGRGRGSVIEVIDASFDTSHEAFAGMMDTAALRLPQAEMASLTSQLDAGRGGAWISDKIPFVYDYADHDTNPYIGDGYGPQDFTAHAHGTRMAALAAANGATYRGGAPDAQLILAKVLSNSIRTVRDSDMLAALDDAMVISPTRFVWPSWRIATSVVARRHCTTTSLPSFPARESRSMPQQETAAGLSGARACVIWVLLVHPPHIPPCSPWLPLEVPRCRGQTASRRGVPPRGVQALT